VLFTAVIPGAPSAQNVYDRVDHFVAESRVLRSTLVGAGVITDRIDVIYPAVDVDRYAPQPAPTGRFTLLFASSPPTVEEIDARGVGLLIDLARMCPDVDIRVLWRTWGDMDESLRVVASRNPPTNFHLENR